MAKLLPRLQELATAAKSTMMGDQVSVAEYIEELERYPRLRDNVEAVKIARMLKHVQQRHMEKDTDIQEKDEKQSHNQQNRARNGKDKEKDKITKRKTGDKSEKRRLEDGPIMQDFIGSLSKSLAKTPTNSTSSISNLLSVMCCTCSWLLAF
ncbi:hypothetical protein Tco_0347464 [Tanacetum coccineum]